MKKTIIILLTLMYCSELFSMQAKMSPVREILDYISQNETTKWELVKKCIQQKKITAGEKMSIINYCGHHSHHYYNVFLLWYKDIGLTSFFKQNRNENFFNELINYVSGVDGSWKRIISRDFINSYQAFYALMAKEYTHCININAKPPFDYVSKELNQTPPMKLFSDIQLKALSKDPEDIFQNKRRKEILKDLIQTFNKKIDLTIKNDDNEKIMDLCTIKENDVCRIIENKIFLHQLLKKYVLDQPKLSPKLNDCFFNYASKEYL